MPLPLPDPPHHEALLCAIASLVLPETPAGTRRLILLPDHMPHPAQMADWESVTYGAALPDRRFDQILAFDLWSRAENPADQLACLQDALANSSQLTLIETNWPQRQGVVPPTAGGPRSSPNFYAFRSALSDAWPVASLGLVGLKNRLELWPAGTASKPAPVPIPSLDAVAFIASSHGLTEATAPLPPELPRDAQQLAQVSPAIARGAKRRLAFVCDVPNWAYANIVAHIAPYLAGRYDVTRFYLADYPDHTDLLSELFITGGFDNIHFMWREFGFNILRRSGPLHALAARHDLTADQLAAKIAAPVLTTTIYDHLFLEPDAIVDRRGVFALMDGYATASTRLAEIYHDRYGRPPDAVTPDGVNTRFFAPVSGHARRSGPLRIGWVGNSAWGSKQEGMGEDPKGLHTILKPAITQLQNEGRDIRLVLADRNLKSRNRDQMRHYYATEIDLLVCASIHEGTPNPVLEAMASGLPWVSTDVGITREVAGPLQTQLILPERSAASMAAMLRHVMDNPALTARIGAENLAGAGRIDWVTRVTDWTRLFAAAEVSHTRLTGPAREELITARLTADASSAAPDLSATSGPMAGMTRPALEAWLTEALTEIDNRDRWIAELQTRIADLESWTETMQTLIDEYETPWPRRLMRRILQHPAPQIRDKP